MRIEGGKTSTVLKYRLPSLEMEVVGNDALETRR